MIGSDERRANSYYNPSSKFQVLLYPQDLFGGELKSGI